MALSTPSGATFYVPVRAQASVSTYKITFTASQLPEQPIEGAWTLRMKNLGGLGTGYVDTWSITV